MTPTGASDMTAPMKLTHVLATAIGLATLPAAFASAAGQPLRIGVTAMPPSLGSPYRTALTPTIFTTAAIYDALTRFNHDYQLEPWLATGWEAVDAKTWRFTLRKGVTFSNGKPFTADAVVNAVQFLVGGEIPPGPPLGLRVEMPYLAGARAIDDHTVEITTTEPIPLFPRHMTSVQMPEPEAWRALGYEEFARAPVGTGPYKLDQIDATSWSLSAVPTAWHPGKVEKLEIVAIPVSTSRAQGIMSGRLDVALGIGPDETMDIEASGGKSVAWPFPSNYGVSFNFRVDGPFHDVRVRRALNMAVNRQRIIDQLLSGTTVPTGQPAPRVVYGYDPAIKPYPYDPAAARKLLADAGFPNGFTLSMETMIGAAPSDAAIFQQVAADLAAVGVTLQIRTMPVMQFNERVSGGTVDSQTFPTPYMSSPSADVMRGLANHSCLRASSPYCDKSTIPLLKEALQEADPSKALALRHQLARHYHDQAPAIFLFETVMFAGLSDRVTGFHMDGLFLAYHDLGVKP